MQHILITLRRCNEIMTANVNSNEATLKEILYIFYLYKDVMQLRRQAISEQHIVFQMYSLIKWLKLL